MPIYQRGNSFMVSVGSGKDRKRITCATYEEAMKKEAELNFEASNKASAGKTLQDAFDMTWRLHWAGDKSAKTHKGNAGKVLAAIGSDTPLMSIGPDTIIEAIFDWEDQGNCGSTVNRKLSNLSMMLKTALDMGWIEKLPKIPRRDEGKHRIRWLTEEEETRILQTANHLGLRDLHDFIVCAVDTGFRKGELLGFKTKDFTNGLLTLHAGATKNDDARAVPATDRVKAILENRRLLVKPFQELTLSKLRYQWAQLKSLCGYDDDDQFIIHMLRHTCASRLVQRGVPLAVVQKWMGHRNIATTLRYAHLAPESLVDAMQKLQAKPISEMSVANAVTL